MRGTLSARLHHVAQQSHSRLHFPLKHALQKGREEPHDSLELRIHRALNARTVSVADKTVLDPGGDVGCVHVPGQPLVRFHKHSHRYVLRTCAWLVVSPAVGVHIEAAPSRNSTMLELNTEQRRVLVDKVPDVGNLAVGALVFGQFLGGQRSILVVCLGAMLWVVFFGWSLFLARRRRP